MPRRSTLPLTSTLLGELLGSHRADIVYTYAGFDLFKIHSKSSALGDPTSKKYKEIGFKKACKVAITKTSLTKRQLTRSIF